MAIEAFRSAQQWKQRMNVIVLKVVSPTRFLIRESSGPAMSPSVREFISLEAEMIHYRTKCDLEPFTSLLPQLGSIVLVQNRSLKKWYRGRVNNVFDTISGYQVEVFLVDYGKTLLVDRRDLHKVPNKRILEVPFQCIEFLLLGVGPLRLTIDPATITAIYVRGSSWDTASIDHVNSRVQKADAVHIEVLGKTTSGGLCGKLFIDCNKNVIALDKELVKLNYAFLDAAAGMEEVILDDYKPEKDDQQPVKESQDEDTSKGSNFWDDIQRKSASAALKEVLDSVYGTSSSSLVLVPLEVCEAEESPPSSGSASGECSPLHWSSSSTSISIDTSSSGTDTPPTLPGLGRGLSLMLRVKEFASDSSCCEPSARGSIDMQTGELSTAMLSPSEYSDEDECYTPTLVGTPPAVFRDRETAYSPEKLQSSSSEPAMPQLETVQSRHEPSSVIPKPVMPQSLADTSHSDECRARGRARLLSLSPNPSNSSEKSRVAFRRSVTLSERFSMSSEASSGSSAPEACGADKKNPSPVMNLPDSTAYRGRGRALFTKVMPGHKDMQTEKLSTAMLSPGEDSDEDACYTPTPVGTPPAVFRERETVYSPEKLQSSSSEPAMPQLETAQSRHEPSSVIPKPVMPQSLADTSHSDECRARGRARLLSLSPNPSSSSEKSRVAFRRSVTLSERFSMSSEASSGSSAPEACAADKKNPSPVMNLPDFTAYRGRGHALFTKVMSGHKGMQTADKKNPSPVMNLPDFTAYRGRGRGLFTKAMSGHKDMQTEKLSTAMLSPSKYSDEDACYTPTPVGTPPAVFRDRETAYSPEKLQSSSSEPAMPQLETAQSRHEPSSVIPMPVMPQSLADTSHSDECRARGRARLLSLSPNPSSSSEESRVVFRRSVTLSERFSMSSEASSGSSAPEACAADKKNPSPVMNLPDFTAYRGRGCALFTKVMSGHKGMQTANSPVMNLPDFTAYRGRGRALFTKVMPGHKDMQTEKLSTAMLSPGEDSDEDACYTPTPVGTPPAVFRDRETAYSPEKLQSSSSEPAMPQLETVQSRHEPSSVIPKPVMPQSLADTNHSDECRDHDECRARGRARLLSLSPNPSSSSEKGRVAFRRSVTLSERFSMSSEASSGSSAPEACAADKKNPSPVMNLPDFTAYRGRGHALFTKVMSGRIPGQSTTQLSPQPLSTQKNSLAQEESFDISCGSNQPKPASSSVQNDTYPSKVITKATRMKDLWGKKGHSLCAASLQGCSSKAQDDSLANFLKPDVTAGTVPALKKEDLFTGTSLSCPGSSTDQMPASTMSSRELVAKFLDASNLKTSYEPDQEFADPCATMGVSQSSEDFWRTDVFSELSADLDPCAQFQSPIYFKTGHDTSRQASQPAFSEVRVLCHGIRPPRPQTHLDQTVFDQFVKSRLRSEGFQDPTCIQTVVWPAVMSGRDIVAVGPRNSGKTLAYLIPLVSRLMSEIDYEKLPAGVGPLMVVLASTWEGALRIYHQAEQLVHEKRGPKICALYPGGAVKGKEVEVVNGCDVLVTTPLCFLRFLTNYGRLIVNLRRCCHVVLDDGERLLDKFAVEVTSVMNEFRQCLKRRKPGMLRGQIIVCSTMWSSGLNWFIRMTSLSQNPLIVFTSFFEAAIYAQVPTVASYVHPNSRQETLLRIVEGSLGRKVVVCTADKESAISLQRLLLSTSINCLLLYDELPMAKIWEITDEWNSVRPRTVLPVLVAQDNVLSLASIRDAAVLIHYDVPELSKYNFGFRFSVLADRMRSFIDEGALYTADEPVAHLILSSGNRSLSVQLVDFLGRLGTNVPDGLARLALEEQAKASSNLNVALCRNLKAFGHCENQTMTGEKGCYYRHKVLLAADHTRVWEDLPSQGLVLIVVTKVVNATCFYAWILQHWDTSSNSTNERKFVVKENLELHNAMLSLNDFFMKPGNFKYVDSNVVPKVGEVYGLEHTVGHFRRVLVLSITPKKSAPASITVFHMDYGDKSTVAARRLLHLPRELANLRPFIMEVFCCRIQPQDCDLDWTFQANHKSYELVLRKELLGKIVLRLGNTLWLDPLVLWESLPFVDAKVPLQNVRSTLIEANLACNNATHLESLRNMAAEAGVLLPNLSEMNKERSEDDSANTVVNQHCTAFLDMKDFNHVYLWKVTSPSDFYIQPLKFNSCLDELENNIQKTMKRRELRKLRSCHPGALCIAHYNNDGWYRGEVQEVLNSSEVNVFFPDYGDTARCPRDELFKPLSWMMLLPYQGIQCSLAGIVSPSGNWSPMAQSVLESFGYDDYDVNRVLCLRVVKKNAGKHPGTNCYEVLLFSGCYKERISAADLLVEQGLAVSTKLPKLSFDVNLAHSTVSLEG
ncbi:uncharacterized protein LOC119176121 isoform X2 [Rhipicephalus microplus]|uniref:uncharacterized protein LOC119176121 isoform X2 n=1 Tax=Rhipicephalus microplus TaxID=6941 RepID=UPI003F6A7045